jgi:hypothetical protein
MTPGLGAGSTNGGAETRTGYEGRTLDLGGGNKNQSGDPTVEQKARSGKQNQMRAAKPSTEKTQHGETRCGW